MLVAGPVDEATAAVGLVGPVDDGGTGLVDTEGKGGEFKAKEDSGVFLSSRLSHFIPGNLLSLRLGVGNLPRRELLQPVMTIVVPQTATTKTRVQFVR